MPIPFDPCAFAHFKIKGIEVVLPYLAKCSANRLRTLHPSQVSDGSKLIYVSFSVICVIYSNLGSSQGSRDKIPHMGKKEIPYQDIGLLSADEVKTLVLKVAPQFFKGDLHQREFEAFREVTDFLVLCGPFNDVESARAEFVSGKGTGKSHASGSVDGALKTGFHKGGAGRSRSRAIIITKKNLGVVS